MNVEDILREHNVDYAMGGQHPNVRPGWLGVDCFKCGPSSKRYHLGIPLGGRYCSCWQCGSVSLYEVLMELTGQPAKTVIGWLGQLPSLVFDDRPSGRLRLPDCLGELRKAHRKYLQNRGFDPDELVSKWRIQGIGECHKLAWRIFIPVIIRGNVISWTTRAIGESQAKYVSAKPEDERAPIKSVLMGEDHARETAVVCEGAFDAFKIGYGAVATLGVGHTRAQVLRIAHFPRRVICFDSEPAAQRRAHKLCEELAAFSGETLRIELESAKDAAEASKREINKIRRLFLGG